ncbi:MAG: hypothetical protein JXA94_03985 [Parachlamydiales bacterium]|nr:hypothetical protein [Parachlamydiales bacterium]
MKEKLIEEFKFCLDLWEKQGYCNFGGKTKCENCAALYLLYKLISKEVLCDEKMKRLKLEDFKKLII